MEFAVRVIRLLPLSVFDPYCLQVAPSQKGKGVGTINMYFAAPVGSVPPEAILYLNGDGVGVVNNCCFPSTVSPSYAPEGQVWSCQACFHVCQYLCPSPNVSIVITKLCRCC